MELIARQVRAQPTKIVILFTAGICSMRANVHIIGSVLICFSIFYLILIHTHCDANLAFTFQTEPRKYLTQSGNSSDQAA